MKPLIRVTRLLAAGAMIALTVSARAASAQPSQESAEQQIAAGIDGAVKALDNVPRLKKLSPQAKKRLVEFIMGNTLFVLTHELGHGVINEMNLPVLGREEDAADSFAITSALKIGSLASERVLMAAGEGLVLSAKRDKAEGNKLAFSDEHGLDLQRAYTVVCYVYGSNPEKFKELAKETKLPEGRQTACPYEWKNVAWSWGEMLKSHLRAPDQPKTEVTIKYEDNKKFAMQANILRQTRLFETIAEHMTDRYAWPKPWTIEARSCGDPNARWGQRNLTLCYELASEFAELFLRYSKALPRKLRMAR